MFTVTYIIKIKIIDFTSRQQIINVFRISRKVDTFTCTYLYRMGYPDLNCIALDSVLRSMYINK
jgi:hypothetical protein